MKSIKLLIPFLCFAIAIIVLYARVFIPHDLSPSSTNIKKPVSMISDAVITIHYHERAPYYSTGPLGVYGICSNPTRLAFKKAGITFRWEKTPASRQLEILKANKSKVCLIGWFKNPEREKFAKYSSFIYQDKPTIAIARADNYNMRSGRLLEEIFQNDKLTVLRKNGYSYGTFVDGKISELNPNQLMTNSENIEMLKMIHSRRADYFFISEEEANELVTTSGLLRMEFKFIKFKNMPDGNKRYLLFSKSVNETVIKKINTAIKKYVHNEL
jgi:polar amino acid transport system substrate-binding protein